MLQTLELLFETQKLENMKHSQCDGFIQVTHELLHLILEIVICEMFGD